MKWSSRILRPEFEAAAILSAIAASVRRKTGQARRFERHGTATLFFCCAAVL